MALVAGAGGWLAQPNSQKAIKTVQENLNRLSIDKGPCGHGAIYPLDLSDREWVTEELVSIFHVGEVQERAFILQRSHNFFSPEGEEWGRQPSKKGFLF